MGLSFRKSFKIGKGFRINLSSRGVGASVGMKGFRIGTGPSGTRMHASIPGTGISWSTGLSLGGGRGATRVTSAAASGYRNLLANPQQGQLNPAVYFDRNAYDVQLHEQHLSALVSLHREGWTPWDWSSIAMNPPPVQQHRQAFREHRALQELQEYRPSVVNRLVGSDKRRRELEDAVLAARAADEYEYTSYLSSFAVEYQRWEWFKRLAEGIIRGDLEACQAALDNLGPFQDFQVVGSALNTCITRSWCVESWLIANTESVVPTETLSLTSTGKLSRKAMAKSTYWALYQDHVCSAALRIGREVFALLPVPVTLVHVGYPCIDSRTGQPGRKAILSVAFDRETFDQLNLDALDPSDSMANFEHRMKFKKTSGFDEIELLTPEDLEVGES